MKGRKAFLVAPRRFEIEEVEFACKPDDVLVKMEGSGVCTSEIPRWTGQEQPYPCEMGHEGWGIVVEKGGEVSDRIQVGDRVTGLPMGCYADYFVQPEWCTMVVNKDLDETCFLGEPYYCVSNVIRAAHPEMGDSVVLVGLGPMGQWALQGLAQPNLHSLIAVDVDDQKLKFATEAGATHTINPTRIDPEEAVLEITGGRRADIVVEGTGVKAGMDTAVKLLRHGQQPKLVVMSFFKDPLEVDLKLLCGKSADVICAHPGITRDKPDHCRRTQTLINAGVFQSDHLITHRYALEDIHDAFAALEDRPAGYIKGIVTP